MRDEKIFDFAVTDYFCKLADRIGESLSKISPGIYEILGQTFTLRVRLHTGHVRGLNVILRKNTISPFDETIPGQQLGIKVISDYEGESSDQLYIPVDSDSDFVE